MIPFSPDVALASRRQVGSRQHRDDRGLKSRSWPSRTSPTRASRGGPTEAIQEEHRVVAPVRYVLARDPFAQERIDDDVRSPSRAIRSSRSSAPSAAWTVEARRGDSGRGRPPKQLASFLEHDRAQRGALREREPLPHGLEEHVLLGQQTVQRRVQIVEVRAASAGAARRRPRSRARGAARRTACCRRGRRSPRRGPASALDARSREPRVDERGELVGGNLLQPHHRAGLVERPLRAEHPFHQARLRAREDIADLALVLDGGAHRVLDRCRR